MIYLDHNATTPLLPEVAAAMADCYAAGYANPASQHAAGRRARHVLEDAREAIAAVLGAHVGGRPSDRLVFTSGGTEANNLAVRGLAGSRPGHLIASPIEHPSMEAPLAQLRRTGYQVDWLGVSPEGQVGGDDLEGRLRADTRLVAVMLGNNETGVMQPVGSLAQACAAAGVPMHTDAVQVVGKAPVDFRGLGVATLSMSAHKFHGPVGIGALLVREGIDLDPLLWGGFQQEGLRPGTESVALAVGMRVALEAWQRERQARYNRLVALRDQFELGLRRRCPEIVVHGAAAERLPHTSNIAFPGAGRQALLMALDLAGVACSTGSACASGSSEPSPTLRAMGCSKDVLDSSLRFSFGAGSTTEEVEEAVRIISMTYNDLRSRISGRKSAVSGRIATKKSL